MLRFEDYVERSHRTGTIGALTQLYSEAIAAAGYEHCLLTSLRGKRIEHAVWFDLPEDSVSSYVARRWVRIDRSFAGSVHACRPFVWSDEEAAPFDGTAVAAGALGPTQASESGIAFPFHAPGQRLDLMSIRRCGGGRADLANSRLLHAISFYAWTRYLDLSQERLMLEASGAALTPRELEILDWCKKGKTRPEIAQILSISPKTVEFHLSNVMDKLGASNQIAAVVIALQRGLLEL